MLREFRALAKCHLSPIIPFQMSRHMNGRMLQTYTMLNYSLEIFQSYFEDVVIDVHGVTGSFETPRLEDVNAWIH